MKPITYKAKLLINFTLIFVVFAVVLVLFQQRRETTYRRELLETRLRTYADLTAAEAQLTSDTGQTVSGTDSLVRQSLLATLPGDLRLTIISRQGKVIFESDAKASRQTEDHAGRPEVKRAVTKTEGSDIRHSESTGVTYFYFAKNYGGFIVRVALPYDDTVQNFMKADNIFLWFVLLIFPVVLVILIRLSDRFGKAIASLRHFIDSAERGLVDYDHISFPHSELGDVGRKVTNCYRRLEETGRQIAAERERLIRHFHYFEEGIAIFSADRQKMYANPRFLQYVNTILDRPTANLNAIWTADEMKPAVEFLDITDKQQTTADVPYFKFNITTGGNWFAVQLLVYRDATFEMTIADVTRTEKNKLLKQQMSNNITHELRTPVSSIRGYLETLTDCPGLSEAKKQYFIQKAHSQVVRLTDLIRDVAHITKTEEAPETLPKERLDVSAVVADIFEELQQPLHDAHMTAVNAVPKGTMVTGNYSLLYSIFRNLTENSLRYAGENTRLVAECYNDDGEYAYFLFYDTGVGVPEEHLKRLFERFYRVTEGRTRDCGGTGLGLSIVRNAVAFHSGTITVRNRKEGGLEFLFTLKK